MEEKEKTPPPFDGAEVASTETGTGSDAEETPMYGSTASGRTTEPAAPALTFLQNVRAGFWESVHNS